MKRLVGFLYVLASLGWTLFGPSFGFLLRTSSCPPRKIYRGDLWAALKPVKKFKNKIFSVLKTKVKCKFISLQPQVVFCGFLIALHGLKSLIDFLSGPFD